MTPKQMPFKTLVSEESKLTLLTIQRRSVVDHLGMNLNLKPFTLISHIFITIYIQYLVYPLHVVPELLKILDIPIAYLTDNKVTLAALTCPRLPRLDGWCAGGRGGSFALLTRVVPAWERGDGYTGGVVLVLSFLAQALKQESQNKT